MVTDVARNIGVQMSDSTVLDTIYSNYCEADGSVKSSSFNAGLSAIIEAVPIGLTGGGSDSVTQVKNFCSRYQSTYASHNSSTTFPTNVADSKF
jgi:hypothetical protein